MYIIIEEVFLMSKKDLKNNSKKDSEKIKNKKKRKNNKKRKKDYNQYYYVSIFIGVLIILGVIFAIFIKNISKPRTIEIELGTSNAKIKEIIKKKTKMDLVNDISELDLSSVGTYQTLVTKKNKNKTINIKIVDTTAPELVVQDLEIYNDEEIPEMEKFIVSVSDLSANVKTRMIKTKEEKKYNEYTIEATDQYGNKTAKKVKLTIKEDVTGPVFSGLSDLSVKKGAKIDYKKGVSAVDEKEGAVEFTYDNSSVNLTKSGIYYVTYSAVDSKGNKTDAKRKITVDHSEEDVKVLVSQIASTLSDDPEELRDYCRNKIKYSLNSGGDDPLWYGLTNKQGNCYVHAMCFQALLNEKGIENQLIWVTNKTHYWNLVKINGVWRHMDSTPDRNHRKISIMTDKQRLSTLSGRKWDTSLWPAAE